MKKIVSIYFFFLIFFASICQAYNYNCYPTNWWVGMKWNHIQVMVHGDKIADEFPMIKMGTGGVKWRPGFILLK